jgi:hypothetical protein
MKHYGDFDASSVVYMKFSTFRPSTGAAFTLGGTPAVAVYKDGSAVESTTGVTLTVDFDARTGMHHVAIDTSADGTFYAAGSFFEAVVTQGTVDGVSIAGAVVGAFTIRKNSSLKPATAGRAATVDAAGRVDVGSVGGTAQTARDLGAQLDATVSSRSTYGGADTAGTTTLLSRLTAGRATNLDNLDALISSRLAAAGYTAPDNATIALIYAAIDTEIATIISRIGTPAGASLAVDIAAVNAKTQNLPAAPAAVSDIPTTTAIVNAIFAKAIDGTLSFLNVLVAAQAYFTGKATGMESGGTPRLYRADGTTVAVQANGADDNGNRTSTTVNL